MKKQIRTGMIELHQITDILEIIENLKSQPRNISLCLQLIDEVGMIFSLPDSVKELAANIFMSSNSSGNFRSVDYELRIISSIIIAARLNRIPISFNEIKVEKKALMRVYRRICKILNLKIPAIDYRVWLIRYIPKLGYSSEASLYIQYFAQLYFTKQKQKQFMGKSPLAVCGGFLYLMGKYIPDVNYRSQRAISEVFGITEVALRNRTKKELKDLSSFIIKNDHSITSVEKMIISQGSIQSNIGKTDFLHICEEYQPIFPVNKRKCTSCIHLFDSRRCKNLNSGVARR